MMPLSSVHVPGSLCLFRKETKEDVSGNRSLHHAAASAMKGMAATTSFRSSRWDVGLSNPCNLTWSAIASYQQLPSLEVGGRGSKSRLNFSMWQRSGSPLHSISWSLCIKGLSFSMHFRFRFEFPFEETHYEYIYKNKKRDSRSRDQSLPSLWPITNLVCFLKIEPCKTQHANNNQSWELYHL